MSTVGAKRVVAVSVKFNEMSAFIPLENPKKEDEQILAIQAAAAEWGLDWKKIAAFCETERMADMYKCTCSLCGAKYHVETPMGQCPECQRRRRIDTAAYMKRHPVDRRINAGGGK